MADRLGNQIWDQETSDTSSTLSSWAGTSTGTPNAQIISAPTFSSKDGQSIDFIAGFTNSAGIVLLPNGVSGVPVKRDATTGPVSLTGGEVVAGNAYHAVYDATAGCLHIVSQTVLTPASITTTGTATFGGLLTAQAGQNVTGNLAVTGNVTAGGTLNAGNTAVANTTITGTLTVTQLVNAQNGLQATSITASGGVSVGANLAVFGQLQLNGPSTDTVYSGTAPSYSPMALTSGPATRSRRLGVSDQGCSTTPST